MTVKLETESDRMRELVVAEALSRIFPKDLFRRFSDDEFAGLDWLVYRSSTIACGIELKCRDNSSSLYGDVFASTRKIYSLTEFAKKLNVPGVFMAAFSDGGIHGINVEKIRWLPQRLMRRHKDRASGLSGPNDLESGVYVPVNMMEHVGIMTSDELRRYNQF